MVNNHFQLCKDTKLLRHERTVELDPSDSALKPTAKQKKIIVCLTAMDSDIRKDADSETMDLNKKDQETSQICRIMHQKQKKDEGLSEGFWIFHQNKINL
jgi:hypothetical protein